jgi:hypothetical protein
LAAVQGRREVAQLSVGAVKRCPLPLLAAHAPQLHYRVEEAQRSLRRENMAAAEAAAATAAALDNVVAATQPSGVQPATTGPYAAPTTHCVLIETWAMGALECLPHAVETSLNRHLGGGVRLGDDITQESLAAQVAAAREEAEATTAARSLCTLHGFRGFAAQTAALASMAAADSSLLVESAPPPLSALAVEATATGVELAVTPSQRQLPQETTALTLATPPLLLPPVAASPLALAVWVPNASFPSAAAVAEAAALTKARALLRAAAVHLDLHRLGPRHQLRLRNKPLGGPNDDDNALALLPSAKGQNAPLQPRSRCVFGLAPAVRRDYEPPPTQRASESR